MLESATSSQHESGLVESRSIGSGSQVEALARVMPGAVIGNNCSISSYAFIDDEVVIGDRVKVRPGVRLCDTILVEDDVFIGANATFGDDRAGKDSRARTVVKRGAFIGANTTISSGITIGQRATVSAGTVVARNVPPFAIVSGNPAVIVGYQDSPTEQVAPAVLPPSEPGVRSTRVAGVTLHRLPSAADMRGELTFAEIERHIPFEIRRIFLVYGVANMEVRGEHAHRKLHQFLLCVHGRCSLMVDDGSVRQEFSLDNPTVGVYVPPLVWSVQYKHTPDAVQLVLASDFYDPGDYIRDYSEFLHAINEPSRT